MNPRQKWGLLFIVHNYNQPPPFSPAACGQPHGTPAPSRMGATGKKPSLRSLD
jgi:hypothetical protein